jgi:glycosyltransferase involved in cell wall biosynthesis
VTIPAISVVMPVYNGEAFLAEAIESILNQTFADFEFIIVDNGSTDKTPEILSRYASRDARIRVHQQEERGVGPSYDLAISLAKGRYIARMDSDDIALPTRFQQQFEFLENHPEIGVLGGAATIISADGQPLDVLRPPCSDPEIRLVMTTQSNVMIQPSVMMRREIVLALGGCRQQVLDAMDYDFFLRALERCKIANLDAPLLRYRVHAQQLSVRKIKSQVMSVLAARAAAALRRSGHPDPLCGVTGVSLPLLESLGVGREQFRQTLLGHRNFWINVLKHSDPDAALSLIEDILQSDEFGPPDRSSRVNASLVAAGIYYRKGIRIKAVRSAARAFLLKPSVAGHLFKRLRDSFAASKP